jgi:hypothetical protein
MAAIVVEIKNFDKILKLASKFPGVSQKHIDKAIVKSIGELQAKTLPLTPVKSGRLIADLRVPHFSPFQGAFGSKLPYAATVHDLYSPGTGYRRPSLNKEAVAGFMIVGVKQSQKVIDNAFAKALEDLVQELA